MEVDKGQHNDVREYLENRHKVVEVDTDSKPVEEAMESMVIEKSVTAKRELYKTGGNSSSGDDSGVDMKLSGQSMEENGMQRELLVDRKLMKLSDGFLKQPGMQEAESSDVNGKKKMKLGGQSLEECGMQEGERSVTVDTEKENDKGKLVRQSAVESDTGAVRTVAQPVSSEGTVDSTMLEKSSSETQGQSSDNSQSQSGKRKRDDVTECGDQCNGVDEVDGKTRQHKQLSKQPRIEMSSTSDRFANPTRKRGRKNFRYTESKNIKKKYEKGTSQRVVGRLRIDGKTGALRADKRQYRISYPHWSAGLPQDYVQLTADTGNAQQRAMLYISHPRCKDSALGDRFGAEIETIEPSKKNKYYRHLLRDIERKSPAYSMEIRDKDELVLVNGQFVAQMNHTEVLNIFHHLPLDGRTRLTLVLRRMYTVSRKVKWKWMETSSILTSQHFTFQTKSMTPVTATGSEVHMSNTGVFTKYVVLQLRGMDNKYISIAGGKLDANVDTGKNNTKLKKWTKYWDEGLERRRAVAISDHDGSTFISLKGSKATLTPEKTWFEEVTIGDDCSYIYQGKRLILAADVRTNLLGAYPYNNQPPDELPEPVQTGTCSTFTEYDIGEDGQVTRQHKQQQSRQTKYS